MVKFGSIVYRTSAGSGEERQEAGVVAVGVGVVVAVVVAVVAAVVTVVANTTMRRGSDRLHCRSCIPVNMAPNE